MSFNYNVLQYLYLDVQILNMGYDYVDSSLMLHALKL